MPDYALRIELLSDASFGRGDGVAGLVNQEIEHDAHGLPIIHGRTVKGLIVDACSELMYGLQDDRLIPIAAWLFGSGGSDNESTGSLYFGTAEIEPNVRTYLREEVQAGRLSREDILDALTVIRRQTAMDETDVPADGSLRAQRAVVRGTVFVVPLRFEAEPGEGDLAVLAACAAGVQRGGSGRTRGRGRLKVELFRDDEPVSFDMIFTQGG